MCHHAEKEFSWPRKLMLIRLSAQCAATIAL
jgi:hypothetical protein